MEADRRLCALWQWILGAVCQVHFWEAKKAPDFSGKPRKSLENRVLRAECVCEPLTSKSILLEGAGVPSPASSEAELRGSREGKMQDRRRLGIAPGPVCASCISPLCCEPLHPPPCALLLSHRGRRDC